MPQRFSEVKDGYHEETCEHCDGCGLVGSRSSKSVYGVSMCTSCNGHGVQLVKSSGRESEQYTAYDVDPTMKARMRC